MDLASSPFLEFGAMKILLMEPLEVVRALRQPYCDDSDNAGMLIHTTEQLTSYVQLARQYGQTVAVHAIGDLAIDTILDVFAAYPPQEGQLDRVIHCSLVDEELLAKLAHYQWQWICDRSLYRRIPSRAIETWRGRAQGLHPLKSLLDRGLIVAGGSDAPIEVPNPLHGIYAAVTRRNFGETHDGYNPHEKISRFEAVRLYTVGAAEIIGQQLMRGKIAEGSLQTLRFYKKTFLR